MTEHQKFFRCRRCGNLVGLIENAGVPLVCCGEPMKELEANTAEAAQEKHVPVVTRKEGQIRVSVGDVHHPGISADETGRTEKRASAGTKT